MFETGTKKWRQLTFGDFRFTFPNWTPDGKSLVFHARHETGNNDDEIYSIRLNTGKMRRLTHSSNHDFCPAVSPDGKRIVFVGSMDDQPPEIFVMQKNGKKRRRITNNDLGEVLPSWHPNGAKLLVTAWRDGNYEICEIAVD